MAKGSIDNFIAAVAANGGMAMSNGYDVEFDFSVPSLGRLRNTFNTINLKLPENSDSGQPGSLINMFCDEAQLPNISSATGQINGRYLGEGIINYPHTRVVSDFSLSWMCDANMIPFKFLHAWHNFIFGDTTFKENATQLKDVKTYTIPRAINRVTRLEYPSEYQATLRISKTERGRNAPNSRVSLVCLLENVYPYQIDAVPLSYGSSQITKVSANFYYTRHTYTTLDIRNFNG